MSLYSVLRELDIISQEEMLSFEKSNSFLLGHPVKNLDKGIELSTGSLGMGLSISMGLALGLKKNKMNQNTFGTKIPFCEPYWYQGFHSPYYRESHISLRNKVRVFVENELIPNVDEWIEKG